MLKLEVFESVGVDLARDAARNYRFLRWLLHRDRDFDPFEKFLALSVIHRRHYGALG